jgi:mono/diheme cytochrome c family protein
VKPAFTGPTTGLCTALRAANDRHLARLTGVPAPNPGESPCPPGQNDTTAAAQVNSAAVRITAPLSEADRQAIERGRGIATNRCAGCHGPTATGPADFLFVPGPNSDATNFRNRVTEGDFMGYIRNMINTGYMPMQGPALNPTERQDVIRYFESLVP